MGNVGGSASGKVGYPQYMEYFHRTFLTAQSTDWAVTDGTYPNMADYFENAIITSPNPYDTATTYDPATVLAAADTRLDLYSSTVDTINSTTDWSTFNTVAAAGYDASLGSSAYIATMVDSFDHSQRKPLMRAIGRMAAGFYETNGVNTSAFVLGIASLEQQYLSNVSDFEAKLTYGLSQAKAAFIMQGIGQLIAIKTNAIDHKRMSGLAMLDYARVDVEANRQHAVDEVEYDLKGLTWELDLFKYPSQALSAINGAAEFPRAPSRGAALLGGALSGALAVAPIAFQGGMEIGLIATLAGAVLGAGYNFAQWYS